MLREQPLQGRYVAGQLIGPVLEVDVHQPVEVAPLGFLEDLNALDARRGQRHRRGWREHAGVVPLECDIAPCWRVSRLQRVQWVHVDVQLLGILHVLEQLRERIERANPSVLRRIIEH